jgi:hypothetical protein
MKHGTGIHTFPLEQKTLRELWDRGVLKSQEPLADYIPPRLLATSAQSQEEEEKKKLLEEIECLKAQAEPPQPVTDDNHCRVCYSQAINCVLVKCGHMCVCHDCSRQLETCPFCRLPIEQVVRIFRV